MIPIFDAHLDLAYNALGYDRDLSRPLAELRRREAALPTLDEDADAATWNEYWGEPTVSLPELAKAQVQGCLATLLMRSTPEVPALSRVPRRPELNCAHPWIAEAEALGQLAYYERLEKAGHIQLVRTADQLASAWEDSARLACVLSMEGCDPIVEPDDVDAWWARGLRTACLAHYHHGRYAVGTGATGPLTDHGRRLLDAFERVGMILDLVHTSEPGFQEAMDRFAGPVFVSHGNCRALVPGDRQLGDEQLTAVFERGGVVGVAADAWMLLAGYTRGRTPRSAVGLEHLADHIDHLCQLAGNHHHAAIGSDLDGGFGTEQCPHDLSTVADLQKLAPILRGRGYSDTALEAIFHRNWFHFFTRHLPPADG